MKSRIPIIHAKTALEIGNNELAFSILGKYLSENSNDAEGWILLAEAAQEPSQIVDCREKIATLRPDIKGLQERIDKVKDGPLNYYNKFLEIIRGYGEGTGRADELGKYSVKYEIKNNLGELKDSLSTIKKQQRHLKELQKIANRDETAFELIPLDEEASTYESEANLYTSTSATVLNMMITQGLEQLEKIVLDLEIRIEKISKEGKTINSSNQRLPIPNEVKIFVWKRDQGKCVKCGNQEKLEYDHIIPVSKGGSNTARNIQLLCETCNRKKSNNIV